MEDFFFFKTENSLDEDLDFEAETLILYSISASVYVFDIAGS